MGDFFCALKLPLACSCLPAVFFIKTFNNKSRRLPSTRNNGNMMNFCSFSNHSGDCGALCLLEGALLGMFLGGYMSLLYRGLLPCFSEGGEGAL